MVGVIRLKETGLPAFAANGGKTKFNRYRLSLPKIHWLDAACVGKVDQLEVKTTQPLLKLLDMGQGRCAVLIDFAS